MTTTHDDYPHPVPPLAYLRWKENYFFILIDARSDVFGILHFNNEPGFDRSRFTCNLSICGVPFEYHNTTPLPADFEMEEAFGWPAKPAFRGTARASCSAVAGRYCAVPLVSETAAGRPADKIVENFCPVRLDGDVSEGLALIESARARH
jgi:hypothetical protein